MKKCILVFLIFIFNFQYGYTNSIENIDKERQNCFEINFQSDYTMAQCNYVAIEKYDSEIQKSLKNLKKFNDIYEYVNKNNFILRYKKNEVISLNEFLHAKDAPKNWKHLSINKKGDVIYRNKVIITDNGTSINEITASESYLLLKIFLIASGAEPKEDCDTSDYKNGLYGLGCYIYESE